MHMKPTNVELGLDFASSRSVMFPGQKSMEDSWVEKHAGNILLCQTHECMHMCESCNSPREGRQWS
jgi:hypothetical protein